MQTTCFLNFLRGEIESGYSSIQNLLYRRNVCKVCTVSKRKRKFINKDLKNLRSSESPTKKEAASGFFLEESYEKESLFNTMPVYPGFCKDLYLLFFTNNTIMKKCDITVFTK